MAAPRFDRPIKLLEPGARIKGSTGQWERGPEVEHDTRASRRDLTLSERFGTGLSLSEQVTRFLVRRGDLPKFPTSAWHVEDDRDERYAIQSVNLADGRRDDDPQAVLTLVCVASRESQ